MVVSSLLKRIKGTGRKIVFPEGNSPLIQSVAQRLTKENLAVCFLVFKTRKDVPEGESCFFHPLVVEEFDLESLASKLYQIRKGKTDLVKCRLLVAQPNYFAMLMVKLKKVDCFLGGISYSTADILRPAFQVIGVSSPLPAATSAFLMVRNDLTLLFADCALTVAPDVAQLVNVAKNTVSLADKLGFSKKKVAMLSFSTAGSGGNLPSVSTVETATTQLIDHLSDKNTVVLGEIQFDAAFSQIIRKKKWLNKETNFDGSANIFIFPDLNSGNIGYKIAQHLGGFQAIGPIVVGLNAPVNDLSRGASEDEVYQTAIITLSQVNGS